MVFVEHIAFVKHVVSVKLVVFVAYVAFLCTCMQCMCVVSTVLGVLDASCQRQSFVLSRTYFKFWALKVWVDDI